MVSASGHSQTVRPDSVPVNCAGLKSPLETTACWLRCTIASTPEHSTTRSASRRMPAAEQLLAA